MITNRKIVGGLIVASILISVLIILFLVGTSLVGTVKTLTMFASVIGVIGGIGGMCVGIWLMIVPEGEGEVQ